MHREIMGLVPRDGKLVDHRDQDGLHNCKGNLRVCDKSRNAMNSSSQKGSASQYKGVCRGRYGKRWQARLSLVAEGKRKQLYLGTHDTEEQAAQAYDRAAIEHFGEFAKPNFAML